MARYIDADALTEEIDKAQTSLESNDDIVWERNKNYYKGLCWARSLVDEQPTADVVPRERYNRAMDGLKAVLEERAEDKAELAREIFEEIENHLFAITPIEEFDGWARIQLADIMRLKQKYTEATP